MAQQTWEVTDPATGRTIEIVSDQQPTPDQIRAAFARAPAGPGPGAGPGLTPPAAEATPAAEAEAAPTPPMPRTNKIGRPARMAEPGEIGYQAPATSGQRLTGSLPMLASMAASVHPATRGLRLLGQMATTGGAAAGGSGLRDILEGRTPSPGTATREAAVGGLPQALVRGLQAARQPIQGAAGALWRYAAGGGSKRTAQEILSQNLGTLRPGNLAQLETPRSPTGAFQPPTARPVVVQTMRRGVERAQTVPLPIRESIAGGLGLVGAGPVAGGLAGATMAATRPLPASFLAQRGFNAARPLSRTGQPAAQAIRTAQIMQLLAELEKEEAMRPMAAHEPSR